MGLSFQCATALTPLADTLVIVGEFLSCSVAAGFILVLPLHHGDLDSVRVSTKHHVAVLVAWPWLGGPICERTSTENVGGAYTRMGHIYGTLRYVNSTDGHKTIPKAAYQYRNIPGAGGCATGIIITVGHCPPCAYPLST